MSTVGYNSILDSQARMCLSGYLDAPGRQADVGRSRFKSLMTLPIELRYVWLSEARQGNMEDRALGFDERDEVSSWQNY